MPAYRQVWRSAHGRFSLNMVSTRGCPFHWPIWGQRYAIRPATEVAAEMADIKLRYAPDHIWFADDIFGLRPDWTAAFGDAVASADAAVPFQIQSRVDLMTEAAVDGLARAGCEEVWLGVESGSQRILDAMEKGISLDQVRPAVERLRNRGIRIGFFLQLGYPGEEWADIRATRALLRGVSVSYPLPGTRFHDAVASQMDGRDHWDDSSDLAMMFHGTYTTEFYRRVHRLLHDELDARAAGQPLETAAGRNGAAALRDVEGRWAALAAEESSWRSANPTAIAGALAATSR
jgi:anaerobic magnesium-protoporphyrin IX monomethyl ester cyclase